MSLQSTVLAAGLACVVAGCGASSQSRATSPIAGSQCAGLTDSDRQMAELYAPGQVARVEPMYRKEFRARAIQPTYVSGAKLYVPAQEGMTAPYLDRVLSCHAASGTSDHPNDPLRVANVQRVDVSTQGQHLVVAIAGADRAAGKEIWQRARALQESSGQVEVRQLSANEQAPSNL